MVLGDDFWITLEVEVEDFIRVVLFVLLGLVVSAVTFDAGVRTVGLILVLVADFIVDDVLVGLLTRAVELAMVDELIEVAMVD